MEQKEVIAEIESYLTEQYFRAEPSIDTVALQHWVLRGMEQKANKLLPERLKDKVCCNYVVLMPSGDLTLPAYPHFEWEDLRGLKYT